MQQKLVKLGFVLLAISFAFIFWRKMKDNPRSGIENTPATVESETTYVDTLPADFYIFYDRFHTDSTFQLEQIDFPLQGLTQVGDSVLTAQFVFWERKDWKLHKPFDSHGGTFERSFINDGTTITEDVVGNGGMFTVQKKYKRRDGAWRLVYYQDLMMHG